MNKAVCHALLAVIFVLSVSACVRDLPLDAEEDPLVVVDCVLCNETPQTLRLSLSRPPQYSAAATVTDAEIILIDKTERRTAGTFVYQGGTEWTLDYAAVPEHEYRLEVRIPGKELVYAEDKMPEIPGIDSFTWVPFESSSSYLPDDFRYDEHFSGTIFRISTLPPYTWMYALNYNPETGEHEVAEDICTDFPWIDNFNLTGEKYTPEIEARDVGSPFEYLGSAVSYPVLAGAALHHRYLRISKPGDYDSEFDSFLEGIWDDVLGASKETLSRDWFIISGSFTGDYWHRNPDKEPGETQGYVVCVSMSESYDKYLRDAMRLEHLQESTDMSSIYYRENIHSNIVGGLGIFGVTCKRIYRWDRGLPI